MSENTDNKKKTEYVALHTVVVPNSKRGAQEYTRGQVVPIEGDEVKSLLEGGHVLAKADYDAAEKAKADYEEQKAKRRAEENAAKIAAHAAGAPQREFSKDEHDPGKPEKAEKSDKK